MDIKSILKKLSTNESIRPDGFTSEFYQTSKEELVPILLKLFKKIEEEVRLPSSFYDVCITLITPKQIKIPQKKIIISFRCI